MWNVCRSPFTYYRINIQAWVVDEHAQKANIRQETLFYGLHALWYELGRGVVGSLFFFGLGVFGMETRNCLELCGNDA